MPPVVFDFDGVLVDTERLHLAAFQEAFAERGWQLGASAYAERYLGFDDRGLVDAFASDHGLSISDAEAQAMLARKGEAYRARLSPANVLYPGAAACIQQLAEAGCVLAVASGSLHQEIVDILGAAGVLPHFAAIVGADDVARSKPAPDTYLRAAELLGADPFGSVAIEDSSWGLEAARAAGFRTVGITTTSDTEALTIADHIIGSIDEFTVDLVTRLAGRPGA